MLLFITSLFCWRLDQSERPDYKVPPEHRATREQKENRSDRICLFNFTITVFEYNIFMTSPTFIGGKLVSRPLENGTENNRLFSGLLVTKKTQTKMYKSKARNFFWGQLLTCKKMALHHIKLMDEVIFKRVYVDYFNCSDHGMKTTNKLIAGLHFFQGPRGPSGLQGPPGIPGNCVTPSSSNTTIPPVFCLPGKPGIKGARGETGKRGAQGPQGSRGSRGSREARAVKALRGT